MNTIFLVLALLGASPSLAQEKQEGVRYPAKPGPRVSPLVGEIVPIVQASPPTSDLESVKIRHGD